MQQNRTSLYFLLLILSFFASRVMAQEVPDLTRMRTLGEKIEAWRLYCNVLLGDNERYDYKLLTVEAKKGLTMVPDDSVSVKAMFSLFAGCAHENLKQYDSAIIYFENCARLARQVKKTRNEMTALSRLNYIYDYTKNAEKRNSNLKRIIEIGDTTTQTAVKEMVYTALGSYYMDVFDYDKAIEYKLKEIELSKELYETDVLTVSPINIGTGLNNLANLFNFLGQHEKALEYLNEARPYIEKVVYREIEETYYPSFVETFLALEKPDSAKKYYNASYLLMKGIDTVYNAMTIMNVYLGEYYLQKNKIDSAYKYAVRSIGFAKNAPNQNTVFKANKLYGTLLYHQGNYARSISTMSNLLNGSFEFDQGGFSEVHKVLADSYAAIQKWDSAYSHFKIYSDIKDTMALATINKNFAEAEAKFQNKEKKLQIETQRSQISYAKKQQIWLIAGLVLLAMVIGLMVFIYFNKQKTSRKLQQKNEEMNVLNENLEKANITKAKLFSIISHDLRNPISQVYQFLDLQKTDPDIFNEEEKKKHNEKISIAAGTVLETMEDLLIWSKTQMQQFNVTKEKVAAQNTVETIKELLQTQAEKKNVAVDIKIDPLINMHTDKNIITIIIRNLLQNAITYSPENSTINIAAVKESSSTILSIADEGPGMPERIRRIFNEPAMDINSNASGLGLTIVKEMADLIHAVIDITPNKPGGTLINITIPDMA